MKVLNHIRYAYDYPRLFSNVLLSVSNACATVDISYIVIGAIFLGVVLISTVKYLAKRATEPYLANSGDITIITCLSVSLVLLFLMVVLMYG